MPLALPSAQLCAAGTKTRNRFSLWNLSVQSSGCWRVVLLHSTRNLFGRGRAPLSPGCYQEPSSSHTSAQSSKAQRQVRKPAPYSASRHTPATYAAPRTPCAKWCDLDSGWAGGLRQWVCQYQHVWAFHVWAGIMERRQSHHL